jgi:predicted HTH domain antitoxin
MFFREVKMKKIDIPDELLKLYGISEELLSQRALFLLVLDLLKQGKISSGKAMQLLGISRDDMIHIMDEKKAIRRLLEARYHLSSAPRYIKRGIDPLFQIRPAYAALMQTPALFSDQSHHC